MPEIPECLNKRYKALDELIRELSMMNSRQSHLDLPCRDNASNDPGIKLMCDFWNILKEDPDCNLTQVVKQRMGVQTGSCAVKPQNIACFMAKKTADDKKKGSAGCHHSSEKSQKSCCSSGPRSPAIAGSDVMPLSKVLCNLKEAASFDKKCNARINDLMRTQKELQDQISHLENREREGVQLLKQADCMWTCMEEAYKKRLADSLHRQRDLMKELKEAEMNNAKWRKNKKDLDSQVERLNKCHEDILGKIAQKNTDIKCMDTEIEDFKKRIENNKKEAEAAKKSIVTKKQASDGKIASIASEVTRLNKCINEEVKKKQKKEQEGSQYVKEAREDLQQISRVLLQKKIENQDRLAEKTVIEEEIELLKQTCDQCQNKCKNNQQNIITEIKKIDQEIKDFKIKCIRCHQCTDTGDTRKFCNDCPKCMGEKECLNKIDHCDRDPTMDCVCMSVKHKFLDNVFENMYTVLERQSKTRPGKAVADSILKCLKNSRNGKLNVDTRKILQDFILDTVKKNLNLTIVGGAVKTRCELDPETYQQLMTCLKKVTPVKPTKEDKGTASRKETCPRWGGSEECNCPGGHKYCVCKTRAPLPPKDAESCPPPVYNKDDLKPGETQACPNKTSTSCGPDCYSRGPATDPDLSSYRKDPCAPSTCTFGTNMRAAQCVLGPESLNTPAPYSVTPRLPFDVDDMMDLESKSCSTKMSGKNDNRSRPRQRIIEEVMGRDYREVPPIEKVTTVDESYEKTVNKNINRCICDKLLNGDTLDDSISRLRDCSSDIILIEGTDALMEMLEQKNLTLVGTDDQNGNNVNITKLIPNRSTIRKVKDNDVKIILRPKLRKKSVNNMNTSPLSSFMSKFYKSSSTINKAVGSLLNLNKINAKSSNDSSIKKLFKAVFTRGTTDDSKLTPKNELTSMEFMNLISTDTDLKSSLHILKGPSEVSLQSSTTFTTCETVAEISEKSQTCRDINCLVANINDHWIPDSCAKMTITKTKKCHNLNYDGKTKNVLHNIENIKEKDKVLHQVNMLRHQNKSSDYANQLKAEVAQYCDQTCSTISYQTENDNEEKETDKKSYLKYTEKKATKDTKQKVVLHSDTQKKMVTYHEKCNKQVSNAVKGKDINDVLNHIPKMITRASNTHRDEPFTFLTQSQSAELAVDLDAATIEMIAKKTAEDPSKIFALRKNSSGHYSVDFNSENDEHSDNLYKITVKRNPSSTRSLVVKKDFIKLSQSHENVSNDLPDATDNNKTDVNLKRISKHIATKEYEITVSPLKGSDKKAKKFCKLKIKNVDNDDLAEPPVVLKITESNNFILVPDKEFEHEYNNVIQDLLEKDTEYYAKISQDGSDSSVIIHFDEYNRPNAFLIRTDSDCLRIIKTSNSENSMASLKKEISVVIRDLFDKLPKIINHTKNASSLRKKSVSDSNIYEKSQSLYSNSSNLLAESHILLKETDSGKYAVVLGKQSKDAFLKNLKNHLQKNPYGKVPVRKTDNGDIIIALNESDNCNVHYGSIKITPSGNIYLTIDEDVIKQMGSLEKNPSETTSKHIIRKIARPKNKGVTTTCNAKPEQCSCDESKCVCAEIRLEKFGWYIGPVNDPKAKELPMFQPHVCGVDWNTVKRNAGGNYKMCDSKDSTENSCQIMEQFKSTNVSLRQCTCNPVIERKSRTEQCFYVIEATCPYHISHRTESEDIVLVPGFQTNTEIYAETSECCYSITSSELQDSIGKEWDSLGYLSPQLPGFLRDLELKYELKQNIDIDLNQN